MSESESLDPVEGTGENAKEELDKLAEKEKEKGKERKKEIEEEE